MMMTLGVNCSTVNYFECIKGVEVANCFTSTNLPQQIEHVYITNDGIVKVVLTGYSCTGNTFYMQIKNSKCQFKTILISCSLAFHFHYRVLV